MKGLCKELLFVLPYPSFSASNEQSEGGRYGKYRGDHSDRAVNVAPAVTYIRSFTKETQDGYEVQLMNQEALIFVHIPKTAGTTLNRIIERQYNPVSIFTVDPHRIRATVARFTSLSERRRCHFRVVRGHLPYGIHQYLPQGGVYITMLREPVARLLSSYYFILRWPLHPLHRTFKNERLGINHLIQLQPHRHNLQCRFISGLGNRGLCDRSTLEIAKENLARFRVVGLAERFEESLSLLIASFGWRVQPYQDRKVSRKRPAADARVLEMLSERNQLDLELYEFGRQLFQAELQKHADRIGKIRAQLSTIPEAGPIDKLMNSSLSSLRFLTTKAISAM